MKAERLLAGRVPSEGLWEEAGAVVRASLEPDGDIHASPEYRKHVAAVLTRRALREAHTRVREAS